MNKRNGLHGVVEFEGKLGTIMEAFAAALPVAALAGAQPILNEWKNRVPIKTGSYKRSIAARITARNPFAVEVEIGTDIVNPPYPFFLEYGTSRNKARPSMTPAFEAKKAKAITEAELVYAMVVKRLAP